MKSGAPGALGAQLRALREAAGFTQEELATIAGLSVHAVSALERGQRRRPQLDTLRALSTALDLTAVDREALFQTARAPVASARGELGGMALPLAPTPLLGRDSDLQTLRTWLADPAVRLITLTGPGGVGKTRLALELAHSIAHSGATRVGFASLARSRDFTFIGAAIAEALELPDGALTDLPARVRIGCENRDTLLVLDNCEHVLAAVAPLASELLAAASSLRLLATSREPLHVRGERQYAVGPLSLDADAGPAVRLFVDRVRDVRPEFGLTAGNTPAVASICRRLDALPLALELAAPWIKVLSPDDLLQRVERDVLMPTVGPRDLPERQQTISATVAWSYGLLDANEQRAFRRFGVMPAEFSLEVAAGVLASDASSTAGDDEALRAAAGLADKSLLLRTESALTARPLYHMLETVRAYASLQLTATGESDAALEALTRYCIAEASRAAEGLVGPSQAHWLGRVREDLENYRAALTWLLERERADEAADIAGQLLFFWLIRGHAAEGIRWCDQILSRPSISPAGRANTLTTAAVLFYSRAELAQARVSADEGLALAVATGNRPIVAVAQMVLGHLDHFSGNLHAAQTRFMNSITEFEAIGNTWGIGNALSGLGWIALAAGDSVAAVSLVERSFAALHHAGPWFRALGLYILATVAVQRGNAHEAIAHVRESLSEIRKLQDKFAFVHALVPLAAAAVLEGNDAWAARVLGARDAVAESTGATVADQVAHELRGRVERQGSRRLGASRWIHAYEAGRRVSIDALIGEIERARR
jgi:predicted ATPase/DNA-binding XRE family transcriptional regulator